MTETAAPALTVTLPCQFCGALNRVQAHRVTDRPKCHQCAKPMLLDRPFALSDATFDQVVRDAQLPVVVDFYADWCGPCRMMAPEMDTFASKHAGRYLTAKVDTDRSPAISSRFNIRSIPTTVLFDRGAKVAEHAGAMRLPEIERFAGAQAERAGQK
jgi:thioredoxin 2